MMGCSINTVTKRLVSAGEASQNYLDETVVGLNSKRIECDEIWSSSSLSRYASCRENPTFAAPYIPDQYPWPLNQTRAGRTGRQHVPALQTQP